jgi:anti-sigma factor RsiW
MRLWRRRRRAQHTTCRQAVALVTDYLDGVLVSDERRRFELHLAQCEHCAEHVRQIRVTIALTGQVNEDDLDPLARADLLDLYRRWRTEQRL